MKKSILLLAAVISIIGVSCKRNVVVGHGEKGTDNRDVASFSVVDVSNSIDLDIDVNETGSQGVTLSGYKNILEHIKTNVSGDTLYIYTTKHTDFENDDDIKVTVSTKQLSGLLISGASDAEIKGDIKGDHFLMKVSGAGDVKIAQAHVNSFIATISGAGDLEVNDGTAGNAEYKVSGAGDVSADKFVTNTCKATVSGAGGMDLNVQQKLDAKVSGTGSITYVGSPSVTSSVSGVGSIHAAGEE